jgi:lactoylglutathione lyase
MVVIKSLGRKVSHWLRPAAREVARGECKKSGVLYFVLYKFGPMKIEHLAVWAEDLEKMRQFYLTYFHMKSSEKYENDAKGFSSYFLSFGDGKTRLELMNKLDIRQEPDRGGATKGLAHFAMSVGSKEAVNMLTEKLRADHYIIEGEPRTTGDGYYESVVLDPEGNRVEITV